MLNHFIHPATISAGQPLEGIQPVQGYSPYQQISKMIPAFKSPEDGGRPDDEEEQQQRPVLYADDRGESDSSPPSEMFRVAMNKNFREMLHFFLIPDHDKIFEIRASIRNEKPFDLLTTITSGNVLPPDVDRIRKHLYEVQMQLFYTPLGLHCHLIV